MRNIKMTGVIRLGMNRTSNILFKPFSMKKWLILIFIAMFAGSLTSFNSNSSSNKDHAKKQIAKSTYQTSEPQGAAATAGEGAGLSTQGTGQAANRAAFPKAAIAVIAAIVLFIIIFLVLAIWVGSRFKFIWFNAIAANDASIVEPFHRHRLQGNSLFAASVVIALIFLAVLSAIIGWGAFNAFRAGAFVSGFAWSLAIALHMFAGPLIVLAVVVIAAIIFGVAIDNFTVMIMAIDKITFMPSLRKTAQIYKDNLGDIALFYLILLLLGIACAILTMVISLIVVLLFLLLGFIIFGLGYAVLVAAAKMTIAFIIYCIVLGIPFLAIAILTFLCVQLPFAVFMRSFTIEYLCSLGCSYTYERIAEYAREKSPDRSKKAVVLPIVLLIIVFCVFIVGLLAAIAIPNFIKARNTAIQRQGAAQSSGNFSASYGVQKQR